jgi:RHS repeat-associated protein
VTAGERLSVVLDGEDPYTRNIYTLFIKFGSLPTMVDYEDQGDSPNADQAVEIASTQAGTYYIMLRSTAYGGNYTILARTASGIDPHLKASLEAPPSVRPDRTYTLWLNYTNTGDTDMTAPLFIVSSPIGVPMRLSSQEAFESRSPQILGVSAAGLLGVLPPGASGRIPVYFHVPPGTGANVSLQFDLSVMISDTQSIDWNAVEDEVRPPDVNPEVWNVLWPSLTAQIGTTWGAYRKALANDASYLGALDRRVYSVRDLFRFEVRKALGMNPRAVLAGRLDAYAPAPGLPLQFSLVFPGSLEGRFYLGPLGRGWSHSYDISLEEQSNGDILIHWPGSFTRLFTSRGDGTYTALPGDYGALTRTGGIFKLTEKDGTRYQFRSDHKLDYVEDLNGNRITLTYNTSGQLTVIHHSNGDSFTLQYNPQGRISRLTDQAGQVTQYGYDASGEHLLTVAAPGSRLTTYAYNAPVGQAGDHALLTVTYPDGRHQYFAYDSHGRLSEEHLDGDAERTTYTYDSMGRITVTNASGATAVLSPDEYGRPARGEDALGRELGIQYGADFNLASVTDPSGQSYKFNYDSWGNVIAAEDPLGHQVRLGYDTRFNQVSSLVDGRGNRSTFAYDGSGNLTKLTYPGGSQETITYDAAGNPTTFASRSGAVITYTYDTQGQLLRKDYPDGSWVAYTYDAAGNLTSASDASGTITMQYDTNTNLLTRITYPSGHSFTFSYDQAGRRTQRLGEDGYTLNYHYDPAGRLERLTDGSGAELIHYEYDSTGRLIRESKGNGTYTTYTYDAAGQLTSLVNYAPDDSVQSRFDYAYDANGNRTSMTTLDGTTTYEYDLIGQLTGVTYPGGRRVTYAYDAAGNRTTVSDNGSSTAYTTNNLNQYNRVGAATYSYDANGNMTSKTDASGTTTYAYDYENRLVRVAEPDGDTWEYTYDALGNRVAVTHNGVETQYVHDPIGLVDVAAEYTGSGALAARYVNGMGLVARVNTAGDPAYYAFDAIGNTRQVSNNTGTIANTYDYDPFGIPLQMNETIPNPFRYVGRLGVMGEANGLNFMRARFYDHKTGHFIQFDPSGYRGGLNLYIYSGNNPISYNDPSGLDSPIDFMVAISFILFGGDNGPRWMPEYLRQQYSGNWAGEHRMGGHHIESGEKVTPHDLNTPCLSWSDCIAKWHDWAVSNDIPMRTWIAKALFLSAIFSPQVRIAGDIVSIIDQLNPNLYSTVLMGSTNTRNIISRDPNEKVGPAGIGSQHFVPGDEALQYEIYFENVTSAAAPAQEVVVTDYLDPDLDWTTFHPTEIAWDDQIIAVPQNAGGYSTRVTVEDYRPGVKKSWWVDISVEVNAVSGCARWTFRILDPETGELPEDPLAGFLPPNDETGRGEGHIGFTILPRASAPFGTILTNQASIVFDVNQPVVTNKVTNTVGVPYLVYLPLLTK